MPDPRRKWHVHARVPHCTAPGRGPAREAKPPPSGPAAPAPAHPGRFQHRLCDCRPGVTACDDQTSAQVRQLARILENRGWTIAVAESLTGGLLSSAVAQAPHASNWFRGGAVAYQPSVKQQLLGVPAGPVVTERCAKVMAEGVRNLMAADVGIAVTGVGGPGPEEGQPSGTVWAAVSTPDHNTAQLAHYPNRSPVEVCSLACFLGVDLALRILEGSPTTGKETRTNR